MLLPTVFRHEPLYFANLATTLFSCMKLDVQVFRDLSSQDGQKE
jgi:hypothetical protein